MTETDFICDTEQLEEASRGFCFTVKEPNGQLAPAFAIRFNDQFFAYVNRCGHIAVRLDYMPGEFFSDDGQTLVCSTHGAEYAPETGACLGGPCYGIGLDALDVAEQEGQLYLTSEGFEIAHPEPPKRV